MAFDQSTRTRLQKFVNEARTLLTSEFTRQLQQDYGMDPATGEVAELERLTHIDNTRRETARILRDTLEHYHAASPADNTSDLMTRIVREQAFTVLNRLCALRMAEARGVLLESVGKGYDSQGFQLYKHAAKTGLGESGETYRCYLFSLFDEFAVDLTVLFDRYAPMGRLFPRNAVLLELLDLINAPDIESLWAEDETIGWIYQYFNSVEERRQMRSESQAPRNSRELAVRNQFFTPRYVVEFLTDNTLGRIWYEMTQGCTELKDICRYLVRRPNEIFLQQGISPGINTGAESSSRLKPAKEDDAEHSIEGASASGENSPPGRGQGWVNSPLEGGQGGAKDVPEQQGISTGINTGSESSSRLKPAREDDTEHSIEGASASLSFEPGVLTPGKEESIISQKENLSQEDLLKQPVYIPFRPLKDPREIRMLDPACGSMHFGLYAFDLFERIYEEAWEMEETSPPAKDLTPGPSPTRRGEKVFHDIYASKDEFLRDVPRLIIEYNIHGVDIDPRAVQIAGLSLWLRAQRAWKELGVKPAERPVIRKSNIVCAEPMPGEKDLLREFAENLQPKVLRQLVEIIFDKMQLAGEAGSLLKIEEEIADAVAQAREEFNKELLRRKETEGFLPGFAPERKQTSLFDFADLPDKTRFWNTAEENILNALRAYAEQAEASDTSRRRLFADDAAKGFAFIDLCRKRFDVVLMNPPFGESSKRGDEYFKRTYPNLSGNILCAFIERVKNLAIGGFGVIYDRTVIIKQSYTKFRKNILLPNSQMFSHLDLGWGVLDANVETAASTFLVEHSSECLFIDVRSVELDNKSIHTLDTIQNFNLNNSSNDFILIPTKTFLKYPNSVLGHDFPTFAHRAFLENDPLAESGGRVVEGHTFITDIFLRYWWEIDLNTAFQKSSKWQRLYNGGEYSRYATHLCESVVYGQNGEAIKDHKSTILRNLSFQGKASIGYGKRGHYLDAHILPHNFISTVEGKALVTDKDVSPFIILALLNSVFFQRIINLYCGQHKHPGYVNIFPTKALNTKEMIEAGKICKEIVKQKTIIYSADEARPTFLAKETLSPFDYNFIEKTASLINEIEHAERLIDKLIYKAYGLSEQEILEIEDKCADIPNTGYWFEGLDNYLIISSSYLFIIGSIFGRWEIRYATGEKQPPELPDPFAPLPVCPPGMLQNADGLPAEPQDLPQEYPLRISWPGILVDDEGHPEDIVKRVREALEVIWREKAGDIEQEACDILGVKTLREYFGKPVKFFADHLKRYSKSRRQAPIYWPLSTASGSYTLWLYYHRLSDQTLYTCVNDFVTPKLQHVSDSADTLRRKDSRSAAEEKELAALVDLDAELHDFRDELLRIAKFWKPNLNDGVQITAAPLWKLFLHKGWRDKLERTWKELETGKYDWSHLAYAIWPERVVRASRKDRSYAIAHNLEETLWEAVEVTKRGRAKTEWRPRTLTEEEIQQIIQERSR